MLSFDVSETPFSRRGCFLSISRIEQESENPLGPGLYLRAHHEFRSVHRAVFKIDLLENGRPVRARVNATPTMLTLSGPRGRVEFLMSGDRSVRIRGSRGAGLRLTLPPRYGVVAEPAPGGRWLFNAYWIRMRYMLEARRGTVSVSAPWAGVQCRHVKATLQPDARGGFEADLDEFTSTWNPVHRPAWNDCRSEIRKDFSAWLARTPGSEGRNARTRELAAYVTWSAMVCPYGNYRRPAMLMSKRTMDQVWSWDHCFNAMALAYGSPAEAWDQWMVLPDHQDSDGALPDSINDATMESTFCKPPVHGWALDFMESRRPGFLTRARMEQAYSVLSRWSDWWLKHRVWPGDSLPHYQHGNDSGWDNGTLFDSGCPVVAPDLAALLAIQLEVTADLAERLGLPQEVGRRRRQSLHMINGLISELWQKDRFVGRLKPSDRTVSCDSLLPCIPIVLGRRLPEPVRRALIERIRGFVTPWGLATERPESPCYELDGYWRGPVWAPSTLLVVRGLVEAGETELARRIAGGFRKACEKSGFAENFDALTGRALRDRAYTWTASVYLILGREFVTES
jgi:glycogen debranching enzyme